MMKGITKGLLLSSAITAVSATSGEVNAGLKVGLSAAALANEKGFIVTSITDKLIPEGRFSLPAPVEVRYHRLQIASSASSLPAIPRSLLSHDVRMIEPQHLSLTFPFLSMPHLI
jgi:hypothetical protein